LGQAFTFLISSWPRLLASPHSEMRRLQGCDIIHWLTPHDFARFGDLFASQKHICTIHHCLPEDGWVPSRFRDTTIVTVSQQSRMALTERGFDDVHLIHNGIDPNLFKPLAQGQCRQDLDLPAARPMFGFFAKETSNPKDRKGTSLLAESLSRVQQQRPVALLLAGGSWIELKHRLEAAGIEVYVRSVLGLGQMPTLYGALDAYLCTSRVEGGPVPVLEAMACQRPVISTPVGHVPELLEDGCNGLLIPVADVASAEQAILRLLQQPELGAAMALAGRRTVLESWTWEQALEPLVDIYDQVLARAAVRRPGPSRRLGAWLQLIALALRSRLRQPAR
jgi:glycosyltransferase involved in cell wall biosynthesis